MTFRDDHLAKEEDDSSDESMNRLNADVLRESSTSLSSQLKSELGRRLAGEVDFPSSATTSTVRRMKSYLDLEVQDLTKVDGDS